MAQHGRWPSYPSGSARPGAPAEEAPLEFLRALAATGGDVIPFRLGRRPAFLLNDPARIEDVLVKHAEVFVKGRAFDRARQLLGNGLLTTAGAFHLERRRVAQAAFHRFRMVSYARVIQAHAARLRDRWAGTAQVDVARDMRELTLGIAGETLFGTDLAASAAEVADGVEMALSARDGLLALVAPPRRTQAARRRLDAVVDAVLARRRACGARQDDLLSILSQATDETNPLSAQQLRDDVVTFLLAAHDTIAHALTWAWILLAEHPGVDQRLAMELAGDTGSRALSAGDPAGLAYTRSVLAEALRLFPPAWVIVRQATRAHRCGNVLIPQGGFAVASPFVTHRDERFFTEPLRFAPERWLAREEADCPSGRAGRPDRCAFFPFGAGPRSCIGEGFAWVEGTLALATLAEAWRLIGTSRGRPTALPLITLRPKGPVLMSPVPRLHGRTGCDDARVPHRHTACPRTRQSTGSGDI